MKTRMMKVEWPSPSMKLTNRRRCPSRRFARLPKHRLVKAPAQTETVLLDKPVEDGLHGRQLPLAFGAKQHAHGSRKITAELQGCFPTVSIIQQEQAPRQLRGQRNGFGFTGIKR